MMLAENIPRLHRRVTPKHKISSSRLMERIMKKMRYLVVARTTSISLRGYY